MLEDFPKSLVLAGYVKMREKLAAICKYDRQKDNVLKATLAAQGSEPTIAEDVDVRDIIQVANADRDKGWCSQSVLEVSRVEHVFICWRRRRAALLPAADLYF